MNFLFLIMQDNSIEKWKCKELLPLAQYVVLMRPKTYTISSGPMQRKESEYKEIK